MNWDRVYINLIQHAKKRDGDVEGEIHHIIPRWRWAGLGKRGDLIGDPDSPDNLVKLTYREHLIAHRILARLADIKFLSSAYGAVMLMLSTVEKHDRQNSKKYAAARRMAILKLSRPDVTEDVIFQTMLDGLNLNQVDLIDETHLTVNEISRICTEKLFFSTAPSRICSIPEFVERLAIASKRNIQFDQFYRSTKQKDHARSIMQGKIWVTNLLNQNYESINRCDFDPSRYIEGRVGLKTTRGMIHIHKGTIQRAINPDALQDALGDGWQLGGLSKKASTSNYIKVWIDGQRDFVPLDVAISAWKEGRCHSAPQRVIGKRGQDVQIFDSLIELKAAGYDRMETSSRAGKIVLFKNDNSIMVQEHDVPALIEQGWNIGRPGAKKRQRLQKYQGQLNEVKN